MRSENKFQNKTITKVNFLLQENESLRKQLLDLENLLKLNREQMQVLAL